MRFIAAIASLLLASSAWAGNYCSDKVFDETGTLSTGQVEKITKAMDALTREGADVRVHVLSNLKGHKTLQELKDSSLQKCGSWKGAQAGYLKNNLVLFMVAPKQQKTAMYYGEGLAAKLNGKHNAIIADMNAQFRDNNIAGGLIAGITDTADLNNIKLVSPVADSGNAKLAPKSAPKIEINHAADNSQGWTIFGWIVGLIALGCMVWFVFWWRGQKEARKDAQRVAQTEFGRCSALINNFESPYAILTARVKQSQSSDKKDRLLNTLAMLKTEYDRILSTFTGISRSSNDPSTPNLSVQAYNEMTRRYTRIADSLEGVMNNISSLEDDLNRPDTAPVHTPPSARPESEASFARRRDIANTIARTRNSSAAGPSSTTQTVAPAATPTHSDTMGGGHTTIINNTSHDDNLLTGILVGNMLNNNDHHHHHHDDDDRQTSRRRTPPPEDQAEEVTIIKAPRGGGGGETDWKDSSSGGGGESSWNSPNFGSRAETPAVRDEPSDCRPTDCKPSDCAPTDCKPSDCDCNCDCNCDCSSND